MVDEAQAVQIPKEWEVDVIINDDNMTYYLRHLPTKEALLVDASRDDLTVLKELLGKYNDFHLLAIMDSHTHADHISASPELSELTGAPWILHLCSPSPRIHLRVARDTRLASRAAPLQILPTPGHTPDSLAIFWGPFMMVGDTILFGDTGRDDLPGGDATLHFEALEKIKKNARTDMIFLTGHDGRGGRACSWGYQLKNNPALIQSREDFVREASAYIGPSPKTLKESLFENFR